MDLLLVCSRVSRRTYCCRLMPVLRAGQELSQNRDTSGAIMGARSPWDSPEKGLESLENHFGDLLAMIAVAWADSQSTDELSDR
jgi:hypothetical protein